MYALPLFQFKSKKKRLTNRNYKLQPDPKNIQWSLTGFLEKDTPSFCQELWNLMLDAQSNPQGVPKALLDAKKEELKQEKVSYLHFLDLFWCVK